MQAPDYFVVETCDGRLLWILSARDLADALAIATREFPRVPLRVRVATQEDFR